MWNISLTSVVPSAASTWAAPALKSNALTGASDSLYTPFITAWWPSIFAPIWFRKPARSPISGSRTALFLFLFFDPDPGSQYFQDLHHGHYILYYGNIGDRGFRIGKYGRSKKLQRRVFAPSIVTLPESVFPPFIINLAIKIYNY